MKIGIVTGHSTPFEYKDIVSSNLKEYSERHGYDLISYYEPYDCGKEVWWNKHDFIRKHIQDYDWIMWIDSDCLFINMSIKIEDVIDENYDIITVMNVINHYDGTHTNNTETGCILFRSNQKTIDFINFWVELRNEDNVFWKETKSEAIHNDGTILRELIERDENRRKQVKLLTNKEFVINHPIFNLYPNAFIVHTPGTTTSEKLRLIKQISTKVLR